jgi:uncharacterized membrane protein
VEAARGASECHEELRKGGEMATVRKKAEIKKVDNKENGKSWHDTYKNKMTMGQRMADGLARGMGSWAFIIVQTGLVACWMVLNAVAFAKGWDPYPFILLNLLFSIQAAYAAPIIMMSQNRQNERDREQAHKDLTTDTKAEKEIEALQKMLARIEMDKLDKILDILERPEPA